MNADLIKRLSDVAEERQDLGADGSSPFAYPRHRDLCQEAATALTEAASENEQLRVVLSELLALPEAETALNALRRGIGTATPVAAWLRASQLIQTGDKG